MAPGERVGGQRPRHGPYDGRDCSELKAGHQRTAPAVRKRAAEVRQGEVRDRNGPACVLVHRGEHEPHQWQREQQCDAREYEVTQDSWPGHVSFRHARESLDAGRGDGFDCGRHDDPPFCFLPLAIFTYPTPKIAVRMSMTLPSRAPYARW